MIRAMGGAGLVLAGLALATAFPSIGRAGPLDEMSLDRWAQLREAERYQMNIAEKYYREANWKVAMAEYEKFLSLHEDSIGAPYAQLKWSLCLVNLRKPNTAIKDGFQSVIDYWPDSPEAIAASYFIGSAYKTMGEPKPAKKAYAVVLAKHDKHFVAVLARVDLLDIARVEDDAKRRVALWRELVFQSERTSDARPHCENASRELAVHCFLTGNFDEGVRSLATTYPEDQLALQVAGHLVQPVANLAARPETKPTADKLADQAIGFFRGRVPAVTTDAEKAVARQMGYHVAEVQSAAGRLDQVTQTFDEIMKTYGADDETLKRLGDWLRGQRRFDESRAAYLRFANKVNGMENVAESYRNEQRFLDAVGTFQQLAGLDPDRQGHWQSRAAWSFREGGKCDEAVAIYAQLLTSDAERAGTWQYEIGNTFRSFGRHQEAIAAYRLCDNFPDCYSQMAYSHRDLGQYNEAIALYLQIIGGHEPSAPWALLQIGYTYEQMGEKEKAIKTLQQVCKKYPKSGYASEAHVRLNDVYKITVTLGGSTDE
jgi:tetratricopeptide (TPR) repeat protein